MVTVVLVAFVVFGGKMNYERLLQGLSWFRETGEAFFLLVLFVGFVAPGGEHGCGAEGGFWKNRWSWGWLGMRV